MANRFIHIKSAKFPVLPEEDDELVNEGTYGKALAQYLQARLKDRGYDVPFVCCEDWGWWVQIRGQPFTLGLCVYGGPSLGKTQELCFTVSREPGRHLSWTRFRVIDRTVRIEKLFSDLKQIVSEDHDIQVVGYPEHFPSW
jgi:hypothetical protein